MRGRARKRGVEARWRVGRREGSRWRAERRGGSRGGRRLACQRRWMQVTKTARRAISAPLTLLNTPLHRTEAGRVTHPNTNP